MADCRDCIHHDVCETHGKLLLIVGEFCELEYIPKVDKWWCKHFAPTADVVPKAEVERLQIEIQALKIANEKMYIANKESKAEVVKEIIGIIGQRNESNNELACGVKSEILSALFRGKEDAYRDIKEILEQKYTKGE